MYQKSLRLSDATMNGVMLGGIRLDKNSYVVASKGQTYNNDKWAAHLYPQLGIS